MHLLMVTKLLYRQPEVWVCMNCKTLKVISCGCLFSAKVCLILSLVHNLFELYEQAQPNRWMCITIRRFNISRLRFASYLVLLASSESALHYELNGFAAACDIAGMNISTFKLEVLHLPKNPVVQCCLQVEGVSLK